MKGVLRLDILYDVSTFKFRFEPLFGIISCKCEYMINSLCHSFTRLLIHSGD